MEAIMLACASDAVAPAPVAESVAVAVDVVAWRPNRKLRVAVDMQQQSRQPPIQVAIRQQWQLLGTDESNDKDQSTVETFDLNSGTFGLCLK